MTRLVLVTKNRLNPAYGGARLGADRVARRLSVTIDHRVPDGFDRVEDQLAILEALLPNPPDALILHPYGDTRVDQLVEQFQAAGTPVIFIVNKPSGVGCTTSIGSDDTALAEAAATLVCQSLRGECRVVVIDGHPNAISTPMRGAGFRKALSRFPDIYLVDAARGDYRQDRSHAATASLLRRHGQLDGILATNDAAAMGAIAALAEAGRSAAVVGINASPEAVTAVKAGTLLASAGFNAMAMACLATEAAVRHLRGETIPLAIVLPVEMVTAANYRAWDRPYEERDCPDWDAMLAACRAD